MSGEGKVETTYHVEYAKSSRAKCKKCKEVIEKGDMKIVTKAPAAGKDYTIDSSFKPKCFTIPRKLKDMSAEDFVDNFIHDETDGEILPALRDELVEAINFKAKKSLGGGGKKDGNVNKENEDGTLIGRVRRAFEDRESATGPAKKKVKVEDGLQITDQVIDIYAFYMKQSLGGLKETLRWNSQHLTGTKNVLLTRLIDGELHGRLARCKLCGGGRLKLSDDGTSVTCGGDFDELTQQRIPCFFQSSPEKAPRWLPWYTEEPSEEEKQKRDALVEQAKNKESSENKQETEDETETLIKASEKIDWPPLNSKENVKKAANNLLKFLRSHKGTKQLDLPKEDSTLLMTLGGLIAADRKRTLAMLIRQIVDDYGFIEHKEEKASKKVAALEATCAHPANAKIVGLLKELAELYFKEGNRNAGSSYNRAVSALQQLDFEITAKNAIGLSKGKTKVLNIGKGTAEKIKEYYETGAIQKLNEKRIDVTNL